MRGRSNSIGAAIEGDREFVRVVSRAFAVMRCFEGGERTLGNGDIALRTGLPPSTVSRLTYTLACIGHLSYEAGSQRYRVGSAAIAMSSGLLRGLDLRGTVRPAMQVLAERVPGTVGLTVRDGMDMVFLEYARSPRAIGLYSVVGTRVSLLLAASGRAYIAAMPDALRADLLSEAERKEPDAAQRLRAWLPDGMARWREDGFVTSCRDWHPHINGLAVPIAHAAMQSTVVLSVGVLASEYGPERLAGEVGPLLRDTAARIATLLDGAPDTVFSTVAPPGPNRSAPAP